MSSTEAFLVLRDAVVVEPVALTRQQDIFQATHRLQVVSLFVPEPRERFMGVFIVEDVWDYADASGWRTVASV